MTGFASFDGTLDGGRGFTLTMKAVNHRHLDLTVRLPTGMDALEPALRKAVKAEVHRGHVEFTVQLEKVVAASALELDDRLIEAYVAAHRQAASRFGVAQEPDLNALLRMPGVMSASVASVSAKELEGPVFAAMTELLARFNAARSAEGTALATELRAGLDTLARLTDEARILREGVMPAEFTRLKAKLSDLVGEGAVSEDRLLTEAALIAARGDVEEELVRLRTHIDRFRALLNGGGEVGRPLDFLLQEMNREANTLLSKSGGTLGMRLTDIGLEMKVGLERAREQVQNVE